MLNDPVNWVDLLGLFGKSVEGGFSCFSCHRDVLNPPYRNAALPPEVTKVPDLTGMGPDDYEAELEKNGFEPKPDFGSYKEWGSSDGSRILIDPATGRVVRIGPIPPTRTKGEPRYRPDGTKIPHKPGDGTHDTGERVKCP